MNGIVNWRLECLIIMVIHYYYVLPFYSILIPIFRHFPSFYLLSKSQCNASARLSQASSMFLFALLILIFKQTKNKMSGEQTTRKPEAPSKARATATTTASIPFAASHQYSSKTKAKSPAKDPKV